MVDDAKAPEPLSDAALAPVHPSRRAHPGEPHIWVTDHKYNVIACDAADWNVERDTWGCHASPSDVEDELQEALSRLRLAEALVEAHHKGESGEQCYQCYMARAAEEDTRGS